MKPLITATDEDLAQAVQRLTDLAEHSTRIEDCARGLGLYQEAPVSRAFSELAKTNCLRLALVGLALGAFVPPPAYWHEGFLYGYLAAQAEQARRFGAEIAGQD